MMSCYMTNLELAPDRRHGVNMIDRKSFMKQGGFGLGIVLAVVINLRSVGGGISKVFQHTCSCIHGMLYRLPAECSYMQPYRK